MRWITGKELIDDQGKHDLEIFDYVKLGLQPYDNARTPIQPPGIEDLEMRVSFFRIEMNILEKRYEGFQGTVVSPDEWDKIELVGTDSSKDLDNVYYSDGSTKRTRDYYEETKEIYQHAVNELQKYPSLPSWREYELHENRLVARSVIDSLLNAYFKEEDIPEPINQSKQEVKTQDHNQFIRSLQITCESDSEIGIKKLAVIKQIHSIKERWDSKKKIQIHGRHLLKF